jgi:hypothetical protein
MAAGRKKRRSLRMAALVAVTGLAVALDTACSATGGTAAGSAVPACRGPARCGRGLLRAGWTLRPGHTLTISVPAHWNRRFWGRTGGVFRAGRGHCQSGDCGGRYQCTGNGAIPATLAEYDMNAWDGANLLYLLSEHAGIESQDHAGR